MINKRQTNGNKRCSGTGYRWAWPLLAVVLVLLASLGAAWAQNPPQVSAKVDRQLMGLGETVTLTLEMKNSSDLSQPDLSVLEKDFRVLGTSAQTSMQLINGTTSRSTAFIVTLEPRRQGQLTIPAIPLGQARTEPITITVANARALDHDGTGAVFVEVEAVPAAGTDVYVQSQISLSVKLFYPNALNQGNLDQPELQDAVVELLDELKYNSRRGNENFNVLERRYAIQPERSGELVIPPIRFEGRIATGRRTFFSNSVGRRVSAMSESLRFNVLAQPAAFQGDHWLPARNLQLSLQQDKTEVHVGEPVTRSIALRALGLTHTQLPDLPSLEVDGGRVYPNNGEGGTTREGRWMVALREYEQAIVPSRAGTLQIPESRIYWWDVDENREKTLVIPAAEITVLPAVGSAPAAASAAPALPAEPTAVPVGASDANGTTVATGWRWSTFAFALLWLATLALWWRQRRQPQPDVSSAGREPAPGLKAARRAVRQACAANDAPAARHALLRWGAALWPAAAPVNAREIARRLADPALSAAIDDLMVASYADHTNRSGGNSVDDHEAAGHWQGQRLWAAVAAIRQAPPTTQTLSSTAGARQDDPLPRLYPQS